LQGRAHSVPARRAAMNQPRFTPLFVAQRRNKTRSTPFGFTNSRFPTRRCGILPAAASALNQLAGTPSLRAARRTDKNASHGFVSSSIHASIRGFLINKRGYFTECDIIAILRFLSSIPDIFERSEALSSRHFRIGLRNKLF